MLNKLHLLIIVPLILTSTQVLSNPSGGNPPPIEIDAFIVNTPLPVEITNGATPDAPLPVVIAPEKIRQNNFGAISFSETDGFLRVNDMFLVPTDKRAVIEHVSFEVQVPVGDKVTSVEIGTPSYGVLSGTHDFLVPVFLGTNRQGLDVFTGSQQVRLYFEPGDEVSMSASRNSTATGHMEFQAHFHGYLIPIPSP